MQTKPKGSCGIFLYVILFLFGAAAIWAALSGQKQAEEAAYWPRATGEIIMASIDEEIDNEGDRTYRVEVDYQYEVDGVRYISNRLYFGLGISYSSHRRAAEALAEYPMGAAVTVYYNPEEPTEAVLDKEPQRITIGLVIGGVLILASMVGTVGWVVKKLRIM